MSYDLAVLGQDPRFGGGGLAQADAFLAAAERLGRHPELLYDVHPGLGGSRVAWRRVEALRQLDAARRLAGPARDARSLWVVATLAQHGGAAPRTRRPYACWLATTINSEWRGRAPGLDRGRRLAASTSVPLLRRIERRVLAGASQLYAISPASCSLIAGAAGLAATDVRMLPIPVDVSHFSPEPDEPWLERLAEPVIGFVGRVDDPRKNVGLLLRAFELVRRESPAARLRLIGSAPAGPLGPGVEATGFVPDVARPLRECALLVSPSRQEGFGIAVAEALACGVPAIVTPSGGPEEMLRSSGAGRITSGWSPEEIAAAILELLGDETTLIDVRRRARAYVEREHAPARFQELLGEALDELDG